VSGGRDDARHGWPLERHDSVASPGWTETHQRTQAFHSRDHGAHADSASSGTRGRWHRQKRRQENDSSLRLLFALPVWKDARPSGANDVQLGAFALEASVSKTVISAGDVQRRQIAETEKGYEFQNSPSTGRLTEPAVWVAAEKKRRGCQRQILVHSWCTSACK
jgi:hypothetical protein